MNEKETSFRRRVYTTIETLIDIENTDQLQEHLPHLHCLGWDEVVEERYVNKQCGFPSCQKAPPKITRNQMFEIDRKEGKIFEFRKQRAKFCSEMCYQKSSFVRKQLDEHPLWITGLTEARTQKVYEVPDESFVSPIAEKSEPVDSQFKKEPSIWLVTDSIIAKVQDMKLSEEAEEPKSLDPEDQDIEPFKLTDDDKDFIKSIKEFRNSNFGPPSTSKLLKTAPKPVLSAKDRKKEDEVLAKLRAKYGNKNALQKKPPILIEAQEIHSKLKTMEKAKEAWLVDLIKSWFTPETRKLVREGARPTGGAAEQILMDFLSGKKVDAEKLVNLPNLDKYNVKEKRLNIFLHSIRNHWMDLEARLHLTPTRRDILSRVASTFQLDSENITGWTKREINSIVIALFIVICLVDVELGDDYFKKDNASPELTAISNELCGLDSFQITGLHAAIKSQC